MSILDAFNKVPEWKRRQRIQPPVPRVIKAMKPSARGQYSKHARGATSGRNKIDNRSDEFHAAVLRGREKIFALLNRGLS